MPRDQLVFNFKLVKLHNTRSFFFILPKTFMDLIFMNRKFRNHFSFKIKNQCNLYKENFENSSILQIKFERI